MKRRSNILVLLLIAVLAFSLFVSCESEAKLENGSLSISLKALEHADLSIYSFISYYIITGTGPEGHDFSERIDYPDSSITINNLSQGIWTFEAKAYTDDDKIVGVGSGSVYVSSVNVDTPIYMTIETGSISARLYGSEDDTIIYTAHVFKEKNGSLNEIASAVLTDSNLFLDTLFVLPFGEYIVQITSNNENIELPVPEEVRVEEESPYHHFECYVNDGPEISKNQILKLSINTNQSVVGNKIQATATCYNINDPQFSWYIDNRKLEYSSSSIEFSFDKEGDYTLTCRVTDGASANLEKNKSISVLPLADEMLTVTFYDGESLIERRSVLPNADQSFPTVSQNNEFIVTGWKLTNTGDELDYNNIFSLPPSEEEYRFEVIWDDLNNYLSISEEGELTRTNNGLLFPEIENLEIPSTLNGIQVTAIGDSTFKDCSSFISVLIPKSVTSIGPSAFEKCTNLLNINIPDKVKSIEDNVFRGCTKLKTVVLPSGITSIGDSAFEDCSSLIFLNVPSSVKTIGKNAFYKCYLLFEVALHEGLKEIMDYAFCDCYNLSRISIPSGLISIGKGAFEGCDSITTIAVPDSVTSGILSNTFARCSKLATVTLENSITSIDSYAFESCTSLTSITIPNSVTNIENNAFAYCSNLTSVYIGNGIKSIGGTAFEQCLISSGIFIDKIKNSVSGAPWGASNATVKWKGEF